MADQVAAPTAPVEAGNTPTPAVAEPESSAPKSNEDYIQAALKEAFVEEGIVKPEAKAEAPKETPKEEAKPPEASPLAMSFEKLAKEKAELRKVAEQVKPYQELLKGFDPNTLQAIARAKASGDPVSALAALGFTHNDYVQRVVGTEGKATAKDIERKPVEKDPEIQSLKSELEQVKQWRAQKVREEMSQSVKSMVTGDKYKHIAGLEAHDAVVNFLNDYYSRTGEAPGETWSDSVKIAADEVEKYLSQEAQRWSKVLTPVVADAKSVPGAEKPAADFVKPAKTLNNSMVSPAVPKPTPKTQEDYIQAALEAIE